MSVKSYFSDLGAALVGRSVNRELKKLVKEASGKKLDQLIAENFDSDNFREDFQTAIEKLLSSGNLDVNLQEVVLATLEANVPGYAPVLVVKNYTLVYPNAPTDFDTYREKHGLKDDASFQPIASVGTYFAGEGMHHAYVHALQDIMRQTRAMGGNLATITSINQEGQYRRICTLLGEVYFNPKLLSAQPSSS